ncbi:hypothetical protein MKA35_22480, partial [[Clostridium] innocuum]|nr:hypothetical protein [[Clostridium] innocuum]MCR0487556.1 hypothetical protein [[Clostridium] innocuum]
TRSLICFVEIKDVFIVFSSCKYVSYLHSYPFFTIYTSFATFPLTAWIIYILMTTLATLSCAMIGMIFGIYAKNQMNANSVVTPAVLILMLIPMFADLMPIMAILSNYLFTGVVIESINSLTYNSIIVTPMQWTVLLIECVLSIIAFLFLYKKNGFEA